ATLMQPSKCYRAKMQDEIVGSDLWSPEARLAVTALEAVVDAFGITSMLDCACGDATWMVPFFVARQKELQYLGVDVVSEVIERNKQRHPGVQFLAQDLSEIPLPTGAELIFSKETPGRPAHRR
ncbi:unnamed protein product, partial [Effrenium voratum]